VNILTSFKVDLVDFPLMTPVQPRGRLSTIHW